MDKKDLVLVAMAPGQRAPFSPVQIQKLMFLIDQELGEEVGGKKFDFEPYDYGPFDKNVYKCLDDLEEDGHIERLIVTGRRYSEFRTTKSGQDIGERESQNLAEWVSGLIQIYSEWVLRISFPQLLSAIYRKYPEMKVNSVFNR